MRRLMIAAGALATIATLATPALGAGGKVSICHATSSATNPYVLIDVSVAGAYNAHIRHHDGHDVIPPFTWKGRTYSQNWDADGRALHANGCDGVVTPPGGGGGGGEF